MRGGTVVIALGSDPETLMPYAATLTAYSSNVLSFLFMNLAETQPDLVSFVPSLARSWSWSDDRKTLTMDLREDVVWSDGVPLTADDVAFTFHVARDSLVAWRSRAWKMDVASLEVLGRHRVRFHFDAVYPDQFRFAKEGFVLPKHLLEGVPRSQWAAAAFGRAPVGCGPFRFESWEAQQRIVLVRNERYCDPGRPYLDRVVFQVVPDASSRVAQLRAGQIDLVEELSPHDARAMQAAREAGVDVVTCRSRYYDFIGYNLREPLFADRRVREALTRAVDRQAIIDHVCQGFAEPFESPVVPIVWAYDASRPVTPYDPQGAAWLLAEAGWRDRDGDGWLDRDGRRLEFDVLVASDNQRRRDALVLVQNDWKKVGVKAEILQMDGQTALERRRQRRFQAYCGGWRAGVTVNLQTVWGCEEAPGKVPNNFTTYCNPSVDSLNALAIRMPVEAARPLFHTAQRLIADDHPYTWLYYMHEVIGLRKRVRGAIIDHRGPFNNVDEWWVADERQAGR